LLHILLCKEIYIYNPRIHAMKDFSFPISNLSCFPPASHHPHAPPSFASFPPSSTRLLEPDWGAPTCGHLLRTLGGGPKQVSLDSKQFRGTFTVIPPPPPLPSSSLHAPSTGSPFSSEGRGVWNAAQVTEIYRLFEHLAGVWLQSPLQKVDLAY